MRAESIVFAIAGAFFGLIVGWMLGAQQAGPPGPPAAVAAQAQPAPAQQPAVKDVDENRVRSLRAAAVQNPKDARPRIELGNLYFDAERFDEAARWYTEALALDPRNVDVSTDLGIAYYYSNQPERALEQFDYSLGVDPRHLKTLLNLGVVKAYGKQDLEGAVAAWQKVVDLAPDSQEGQTARKILEGLRSAHPEIAGAGGGTAAASPSAQAATKK
jgi:cytochrome c-type biogenesis protein CcmH/NrfG